MRRGMKSTEPNGTCLLSELSKDVRILFILSSRVLAILKEARQYRSGSLIFWSAGQREMSDNTLNKSVKQHYVERFGDGLAKDAEIPTFHGFRATFKTWVEEGDIPFSDRVVEAMQGHYVDF